MLDGGRRAVPVGHADARDVRVRGVQGVDEHHRQALVQNPALVLLGEGGDDDDDPERVQLETPFQPLGDRAPTGRADGRVDAHLGRRLHDAPDDFQGVGARQVPEHGQDLPRPVRVTLPGPDIAVFGQQRLDPGPCRLGHVASPVDDLRNGRERDTDLIGYRGEKPVLGIAARPGWARHFGVDLSMGIS